MADRKIGGLLEDLINEVHGAALSDERGYGHIGDSAVADARAAIVAHVWEREVELMALAMFARQWRKTDADPLALWVNHPPQKAPYLDSARALRDAYDAAQPGEVGE